jgi:hypothetical protein
MTLTHREVIMKRKIYLLWPVLCLLFMVFPLVAYAAGLGVYGSFDFGEAHFTDKGPNILTGDLFYKTYFVRQERSDFGIVVDTTIAKDSLFNYRLNIGAGFGQVGVKKTRRDLFDIFNPVSKTNYVFRIIDFQMFHSFGFGVVRTPTFRLWIGPQFGYGYADHKYGEVYFKLGPIIGFNFNIGEVVTLFFDIGARFYAAVAKIPSTSTGYTGFANAGILFRINDTYR